MQSNIYLTRGTEFAREAVREDKNGNYVKAINLYTKACEYLWHYKKIMNAPQITNHFLPRINGYVKRAEQLKKVLETSSPAPPEEKTKDKEKEEKEEEDDEEFDLDEELKKLVGMKNIKREILAMRREMMLDKRRVDLGLEIEKAQAPHIAFYGNPGTGKTRIARLIGKIFKQLKVIPKGKLVEVQRSDLVAG